ncbi:MAG: DegV family protein [Candidatus Aminicenantales bacterium]
MKIRYLNSRRLYYAFLAGGNAVIQDKDYLNRINVFPVPDADTGTNLAATMRSIAQTAVVGKSLRSTFRSIADAALSGARGNSGLIFAQFLYSLSNEVHHDQHLTAKAFAEMVRRAVQAAQQAILHPVEGTMLTVMREWAEAVHRKAAKTADFVELLHDSLQEANRSLMETPKKLQVLARAGVVDAGAKGFVDFIEGVWHFIRSGRLRHIAETVALSPELPQKIHSFKNEITYRYCTEALLEGRNMDLVKVRTLVQSFGESAIVAGSEKKLRFHVHTNAPADLFFQLKDIGATVQIKADDMRKQYEASHNRRSPVALVTDSACDLPQGFIDEHQIQVIPFNLSFGNSQFLDKLTITPTQFYTLLKTRREHPQTSQAPVATMESLFSFLSTFYDSIIVFNISGGLSGALSFSRQAAEKVTDKKITVIDTKTLSAAQGLIVMRAAEALSRGATHDEIVRLSEEWIAKTRVLVDIATLKYLVRGGRISPMKGLLARLLHLKPIITIDENGKGLPFGKSFGRKGNMKKILAMIAEMAARGKIWRYAIVHAQNPVRARLYAQKLEAMLGRPPAYVMDVSPVVGAHNGIGVLGVALMHE